MSDSNKVDDCLFLSILSLRKAIDLAKAEKSKDVDITSLEEAQAALEKNIEKIDPSWIMRTDREIHVRGPLQLKNSGKNIDVTLQRDIHVPGTLKLKIKSSNP